MSRQRLVATIAPAVFAVALAATACSDVNKTELDRTSGGILDSADQVAFGSRTLVTDAGLLRAEVFADTTLFLDQNARLSMRVVKGDFFNAQGAKDATLTAERANYDSRTQNLQAWGDVIVTSVDGRILKSPMLVFNSRDNQILSDSAFVLTEPDGKEMRGVGFRADPNLNVIRVLRLDRGRGGAVNLSDR
ncbi:MAG: LPS export ABC transporter periplasmic protein LptC [Gemmatimonadaceae bacterium]|nr:LPS export ABC transporter periplasmic protein LptC [Gemmatimonadaceae bacterium]